jgi:hypothetical protein
MATQEQPLSNLQLELLKAFSHHLSDADLLEIRTLLAQFFARKAIEEANKVWDQEAWNEATVEKLLHSKERTPYTAK